MIPRSACANPFVAVVASAAAALACTSTASAQVPRRGLPVFYRARIGAQMNGLGAAVDAAVGLRWNLAWTGVHPIVSAARVSLGTTLNVTPAYVRPGVALDVQPVDFLELSVAYESLATFGILGSLTSYDSPTQNYFEDAFVPASHGRIDAAGGAYATTGSIVTFGATLRFAVSRLLARAMVRASRYDMDLADRNQQIPDAGRDRFFVDPLFGTLIENHGVMVRIEADTGVRITRGTIVGLRYSSFLSPYSEPDPEGSGVIHRVGPVFAYTLFERPGAPFDAPTLLLLAQWHAVHRFRAGQEVSAAVPYVAIGFSIRGDVL